MGDLIAFFSAYFDIFVLFLVLFVIRACWFIGHRDYVYQRFDEPSDLQDQLWFYGLGTFLLIIPVVLGCLN